MNVHNFPLTNLWNHFNFKQIILASIFIIFLISNSIYLSRVPGLLGDEGDEGHNIQELLTGAKPPTHGERSYIGVWIDYLRIPFIYTFGHNALALRIIMFFFSCGFFWLSYIVLQKTFGEIGGLFGLVTVVFSPIYWSEMRIGWAITLLPFFAILTIYFILQKKRWSSLLAGISAGFGLSAHILFLPTLVGIILITTIKWLTDFVHKKTLVDFKKALMNVFLATIGFWAIFGIQFVNLLLQTSDQGNIKKTASLFTTRLTELSTIAPKFISGSLFFAQYTAKTFRDNTSLFVTIILLLLVFVGLVFGKHKYTTLLWLFGFCVSLVLLIYMIEYYAIRYFLMATLGVWLFAGLGLGTMINRFFGLKIGYLSAVLFAITLTVMNSILIIFPFLANGGSNDSFRIIGSRYEFASPRVETQQLLGCVKNLDQIFSNNVHIRNRLYYWADDNSSKISVAVRKADVRWLISYRMPNDKITPDEICPYLKNFRVTPVTDQSDVDWPK